MNSANGPNRAPRRGTPGTVLIVDDSQYGLAALELACDGIPGMQVRSVSSAREAVRILDDPGSSVRALLTDIRMPAMDGFDLIRYVRAHRGHTAMPIIVVSADTDPDTSERASRLGANAFFGKPFSPRAVRRTLEELLYVEVGSE